MINADGDISIKIPHDKVTWYQVRRASRILNGDQGGWRTKTHWIAGLDSLVRKGRAEDFLKEWTVSSLGDKVDPAPRKKDFQFAVRAEALIKNQRGENDSPEDRSENELNWNLSRWIQQEFLPSQLGQNRFATYELPLAAKSDGQLKADVVVFDRGGFIEIIELKNLKRDNPLKALIQAICYTLQLLRCWPHMIADLKKEASGEWPSMKGIKTISIVVAAPKEYWEDCKKRDNRRDNGTITKEEANALRAIVSSVNQSIHAHLGLPDLDLILTLADVIESGTKGLRAIRIEGFANQPPEGSVVKMAWSCA